MFCPTSIRGHFVLPLLAAGFLAVPGLAKEALEKEEPLLIRAICGELLALAENQRTGADSAKGKYAPMELVSVKGAAPEFLTEWRAAGSPESKTTPVAIGGFFFDPVAYAAWLTKVQPVAATAPGRKSASSSILQTLLTPTAENLVAENRRLSDWLTAEPGDPDACEEAALLAALTAMREAAGDYRDSRPAVCRTVSFLAFASALRPKAPRSEPGAMAELALEIICRRQVGAVAAIEKWRKAGFADPSVEKWLRVLDLHCRGDWRQVADPKKATLLEQIEYVRALTRHVSVEKALEFTRSASPAPAADWPRLLLSGSVGVEQGHLITALAMESEFIELRAVAGPMSGTEDVKAFLNTPPAGPVTVAADGGRKVEPIDRGMWAQFAQRHLLHVINEIDRFLEDTYSEPGSMADFVRQTTPLIDGLSLSSSLAVARAKSQEEFTSGMQAMGQLQAEHPLWISPQQLALKLRDRPHFQPVRILPETSLVFVPQSPTGTVLDPDARVQLNEVQSSVELLEAWHQLAPYDPTLIAYLELKLKEDPARMAKIAAPVADYNLRAMRIAANSVKDDPAQYRARMQKVCELNPNEFRILGNYLVEHHLPDEAAIAYQLFFDHAPDRVRVANSSQWLVNYYFDHGQKEKALEIARHGAEVFSYRGLATMGHLMERMENLAEAEKQYQDIRERYADAAPLVGFYGRALKKPGGNAYRDRYEREKQALFPAGIEQAQLDTLPKPPLDGVLIGGSNDQLQAAGIGNGDIMVALDGHRMHNLAQYAILRDESPGPTVKLIVWKRDHYHEGEVRLDEKHRLGVDVENYKPR